MPVSVSPTTLIAGLATVPAPTVTFPVTDTLPVKAKPDTILFPDTQLAVNRLPVICPVAILSPVIEPASFALVTEPSAIPVVIHQY